MSAQKAAICANMAAAALQYMAGQADAGALTENQQHVVIECSDAVITDLVRSTEEKEDD